MSTVQRGRWLEIERVYHDARDLRGSERAQFLAQACAGDESLRREVESLLAQEQGRGSFLGTLALEVAARALAEDQAGGIRTASPDSMLGQTVSHYRILEKLGGSGAGFPNWSKDDKYIFFDVGTSGEPVFYRVDVASRKTEEVARLGNAHLANGVPGFPWRGLSPDGSPLIARQVGTQEIYALDVHFP